MTYDEVLAGEPMTTAQDATAVLTSIVTDTTLPPSFRDRAALLLATQDFWDRRPDDGE